MLKQNFDSPQTSDSPPVSDSHSKTLASSKMHLDSEVAKTQKEQEEIAEKKVRMGHGELTGGTNGELMAVLRKKSGEMLTSGQSSEISDNSKESAVNDVHDTDKHKNPETADEQKAREKQECDENLRERRAYEYLIKAILAHNEEKWPAPREQNRFEFTQIPTFDWGRTPVEDWFRYAEIGLKDLKNYPEVQGINPIAIDKNNDQKYEGFSETNDLNALARRGLVHETIEDMADFLIGKATKLEEKDNEELDAKLAQIADALEETIDIYTYGHAATMMDPSSNSNSPRELVRRGRDILKKEKIMKTLTQQDLQIMSVSTGSSDVREQCNRLLLWMYDGQITNTYICLRSSLASSKKPKDIIEAVKSLDDLRKALNKVALPQGNALRKRKDINKMFKDAKLE